MERQNNFDALRLVAAAAVVFSHSFLIAEGTQDHEPLIWLTGNQSILGLVGVFVFFAISGFLVTQSFEQTGDAWRFLAKRGPEAGSKVNRQMAEALELTALALAKREPQAGTTSGRFQHEGQEWDVLFHDPVEIGAETHLTASHNMVKGWETRIAAVDLKGGRHLGRRSHGAAAALARTTARFDKLPLAQIKEFQFQVRPYRWAEFRNVSLQAGHRTNVEVRDADVTGLE